MKVKDVMSVGSLKHCTMETKLHNVAKTMKDNNTGSLPILDKENKVVGMLTDRDIAVSLAAKKESQISALTVKDVFSGSKVHTIKAEDTIDKALQEMRKFKVGRLPVTDKEGKLKGVLSVNNLLSHSITKKEDIGEFPTKEESLAKTISALFDRNSSKQNVKKGEQLETYAY